MKENVFNCLLREAREVAVVTLVGRLFTHEQQSHGKNGHPCMLLKLRDAGRQAGCQS